MYAYRPLVGERSNGVFRNEAGQQDPLRDWDSFRSWNELADWVSTELDVGIGKVFSDATA